MADGPRILELRSGRGEPSTISLKQGTVLDPTSIGTAGMWRIEGPGVLEVHGFVYFDGKALYVQSADEKSPLSVNKHRVATAWTEVRAPSAISMGDVEIIYRDEQPAVYDDGDDTVAAPLAPVAPPAPPQFVPGGGMFANRADDESTRFAPIEGMPDPMRGGPGTPAGAFPVPGMPMDPGMMPMQPGMQGMPPGMMPGMQGMQGMQGMPGGMPMQGMPMQGMQPGMHPGMGMPMQPGMQGMPPGMMPGMPGAPGMPGVQTSPGTATPTDPGAGKKGWEKFKAEWEALPPIRRALYIMAPFTFAAACFILFDDPPPVPPKTVPSASPSVSAGPSASAPMPSSSAPNTMVAGGVDAGGAPLATATDAGAAETTPTAADTSSKTPDKPAPPEKPDKPEKDAGNNGAPPAAPAKRTIERMAADAWAEGNFAKAAELYDQLAAENPQNPAYREAARILREKLDAGAK